MISRAKLKALSREASARTYKAPAGGLDSSELTPEDLAFFQKYDGIPLDNWSIADREKALVILQKYEQPKEEAQRGKTS